MVMASSKYQRHLRSEKWASLRQAVLRRDKTCVLCNSPSDLQVHHRTYARLGKERLTDLATLCQGCHAHFHRIAGGREADEGYPRPGQYASGGGGPRQRRPRRSAIPVKGKPPGGGRVVERERQVDAER